MGFVSNHNQPRLGYIYAIVFYRSHWGILEAIYTKLLCSFTKFFTNLGYFLHQFNTYLYILVKKKTL